MARRKETPTNLAAADRADTLRKASAQLVKAQEGLETARAPVKAAKAVVKAAGIDHDIFRLFHGIRHAEDDDQRKRRLSMIEVAWDALLGDVTTADLFRGTARPALAPEVVQDLRDASDALHEDEPQDEELPFDVDQGGDAASEANGAELDAPGAAEADGEAEPAADLPVIMTAESMPADAGAIANDGYAQGRAGAGQEANPHEAGSAAHTLWERGRQRGEAEGPEEPSTDTAAEGEASEETVVSEQEPEPSKRGRSSRSDEVTAHFEGYDAFAAGLKSPDDCPYGRGVRKAAWITGFARAREGQQPSFQRPRSAEVVHLPVGAHAQADLAAAV